MNNRNKMYDTNIRIRNYLLNEEKCTDVWFKNHTRRLDKTHTPNNYYFSRDLFNLFDGVALNTDVIFFQAKTTNFPKSEPLNVFAKKFQGVYVFAFVTRKIKGRIHVLKREYPYE